MMHNANICSAMEFEIALFQQHSVSKFLNTMKRVSNNGSAVNSYVIISSLKIGVVSKELFHILMHRIEGLRFQILNDEKYFSFGSLKGGVGIDMNMRVSQSARSRRTAARNRALLIAAAVLLFAGLFVQITMLSRVSAQNKRASAMEKEIVELGAYAENLELSINQYHNLESIAVRARQLGMEVPDKEQIRVVSVARSNNNIDTSIQAVEAIDGEKVIN